MTNSFLKLLVLAAVLWMSANAHAATNNIKIYKYSLTSGVDKQLCSHMTQVLSANFASPWEIGYLSLNPNPVTQGVPLNQVFDRFPGIEYNERHAFEMLYSKYPTTPEFEAIHWREGLSCLTDSPDSCSPVLMAKVDIDNDGVEEWVVKTSFMKDILSWEAQNGFGDDLRIFEAGQFDPSRPYSRDTFVHGQKPNGSPRYLKGALLRPFIFNGSTYLAAYEFKWAKKLSQAGFLVPSDEHMNILRVTKGGYYFDKEVVKRSNTETVCTIQMDPQRGAEK